MIAAYADTTSVAAGRRIGFHLTGDAEVEIVDSVSGEVVHRAAAAGPAWRFDVPAGWRSSLYCAAFRPPGARSAARDGDGAVWFAVRPARPASPILLSVPFATWQAYNRFDVPGEGLYGAENPERAARVSFDRPGGGPPPERWEHGLMAWLRRTGIAVDYCSNLDLHGGDRLLAGYRLLVVNGHDEYWSAPMRDAVEAFTRAGGNVAFFAANTAWWQMRLEDAGRTMVCHRDAYDDPMYALDPARTTVEWSSAPVGRPENAMTGVSFRAGAGAWGPFMARMREEAYTVRFAEHWVFAGTGLRDGDRFARGALGYETDAAEFVEVDGVPRVTGRDGTPADFTVLATADLDHWSEYGQGGAATMGVFAAGAGTVFNAATVNWGAALDDPVVARITRNVVDRLAGRSDPGWEVIGAHAPVRALAACAGRLYAVTGDDGLATRELCRQNLRWRRFANAPGVVALAAPREAVAGGPLGLYALTDGGRLLFREAAPWPGPWTETGKAPTGAVALAAAGARLYAADDAGTLWVTPLGGADRHWEHAGPAPGVRAMTGLSGRLYALDRDGRIVTRTTATGDGWRDAGRAAPGTTALAGGSGALLSAGPDGVLRRRDPFRPHAGGDR